MKNLIIVFLLTIFAILVNGEIYKTPNIDGTVEAVDDETGQVIAQGGASDGGSGVAGILFGVFSIIIGLILSLIGLREQWRIGAGLNIGLIAAMIIWVVFIDNIGENSLATTDANSDVIIFVATAIVFLVVCLVVIFARGVKVGQALLGPVGFASCGLASMLFIPTTASDELYPRALLVGILAGFGLLSFFFRSTRRAGQALGVALTGLFLFFLGVDLFVNSPNGMSLGLRKFFDSNLHHYLELDKDYEPPVSTIIMCALTLGLSPLIAFAQHKLHPSPIHQWGVDEESREEKKWSRDVNKRYRPSLPTSTGVIYGGRSTTTSMTSSINSIQKPQMVQRPPPPPRVRTRSSANTFSKVVESPLESEFDNVQKLGYASGDSTNTSDDSHDKQVVEPVIVDLKDNNKDNASVKDVNDIEIIESSSESDDSDDNNQDELSHYSHSTYSPTKRDLSIINNNRSQQRMSQYQLSSQHHLASLNKMTSQSQLAKSQSNADNNANDRNDNVPSIKESKSQAQSLALSNSMYPSQSQSQSQVFSSRHDSIDKLPVPPPRNESDPVLMDNFDTISRLERHLSMIVEDRATEMDLMAAMPGSPLVGPAPRRASVMSPKMHESPSTLTESATFSPVQSNTNINGVTLTEALTDDHREDNREDRLKESMDAISLHPSLIDDDDITAIYKYDHND